MARGDHSKQLVALLRAFGTQPILGVEIGVHRGETSARLLRDIRSLSLFMVDIWAPPNADSSYVKVKDPCALQSSTRFQENRKNAIRITDFAKSRRIVLQKDSSAALGALPAFLDFCFIDADHSYEGCLRDLRAYWPRIRSEGLFSGHDYYDPEHRTVKHTAGVGEAVDDFFAEQGLDFSVGKGSVWWCWKP